MSTETNVARFWQLYDRNVTVRHFLTAWKRGEFDSFEAVLIALVLHQSDELDRVRSMLCQNEMMKAHSKVIAPKESPHDPKTEPH